MRYLLFALLPWVGFSQPVPIIPQPQQVILSGDSIDVHKFKALTFISPFQADKYNDEAYHLVITKDSIYAETNSLKGSFYAELTYRQLCQNSKGTKIPCCDIIDYPSYQYRAMHLDVCRHFFSKEYVKHYIDTLAYYKINTLHWHLTDDQGWRIEIKKYPRLTEVGAWRIEKDGTRYGGFYSQADIKEIIAYAAKYFITIIPEIEIPGHSSAALAAYPFLSCTGRKCNVPNTWGIKYDIYAPTDTVFHFMEGVMDEICDMFPSLYIHIGGDEAPKAQWRSSSAAQEVIRKNNLKNEEELQHYFMHRIELYLNTKGKKTIGWGEVVKGGLSDSMVVMSWLSKAAGTKAAIHGNDVIMTPRTYCYFDYPQSTSEPLHAIWMLYLSLKKVYAFDPMPTGLTPTQQKHIIGGEATLWTEYVKTEAEANHQLLPRLAALAESLWTKPERKNFKDFLIRLHTFQNKVY